MRSRLRRSDRLLAVSVLALTLAAAPAPDSPVSQSAEPAAVQYRVSFPAPEHHYAQVEVTFPNIPAPVLEARMSRSSPGRYAVHEFAKNVFDLHAFDGRGRALQPTRPNPYQWNVTGHDGTVRIVYKVFGRHVDGTYLAVDASHAHMNMPAALMWARGFDMRAARVTFEPPANLGWKVATQLFPTGDPWTFTAPNFQYLMDSPAELSDFTLRSFKVRNPDGGEYTIHTAVHHDGEPSAIDEYAAATEKIVNEMAAVFGEFPAFDAGAYTFLGDYVPWGGDDGMEHRNSAVVASPISFKDPRNVRGTLGTVSHEFFHAWNIERIRPQTLEPFDFEQANISGELWLAEGFTSYYAPLVLARAGLDPGQQGDGLVRSALSIINGTGRQFHSAVEMSQRAAFSDAAVSIDETNFSNTFISYYTYGAAIATALDLSLRGRSNGRITLDDFMRAMWIAHGKPGGPSPAIIARPYTLKDARDRLAEVSGDRAFADEFFSRYIEGREVPDYAKLFASVGLVLRKRHPGAPWIGTLDTLGPGPGGGGRGRRGGLPGATPSAVRIPALVAWGTPAFNAGLEEGDVITSADGRPVATSGDWQSALGARKPGDQMRVGFMRFGKPLEATIVVGEDPALDIVPVESTGASLTPSQKRLRDGWLATRRK